MRLGIISDCIHYKNAEGRIGTENHILLRQFEELAGHFSATIIACAFSPIDHTKVISWYSEDIKFLELPEVGGDSLKDKLQIFKAFPKWIKSFKKIDKASDIVYQRFPNNLNLPGFFYFYLRKKKVFATYTGTWPDYKNEPKTYKFQKWVLKNLFRGPVWVYSNAVSNNKRIKSGFSPSYSMVEWKEEEQQVTSRIAKINENGLHCFHLVTVGKLIYYKNQITILKACSILKQHNFSFTLKVVGDGPMTGELNNYIIQHELTSYVEFVGKKNYQQLRALYRQSDFVVQAPIMEGFGKVPVEGFFHGVVPILNNVSMAGYMTGKNEERGFLFNDGNAENLADKVLEISKKISLLPTIIKNGRQFAQSQTLESWANEYYETVYQFYQ